MFVAVRSHAQLRADFSISTSEGCAPLQISFTNTTQGAGSDAVYQWTFGNGNSSSLKNAAAVYYDQGEYSVKLIVTSGGKSSEQTKKITVFGKPSLDFSTDATKGCLPFKANFKAIASSNGGAIVSYAWDFGDGNTQVGANSSVSNQYLFGQNPTVNVTVKDAKGCSNTLSKKDIINLLPIVTADFDADKKVLCRITDAVKFTGKATGTAPLTYAWNFGDGNSSNDASPSYAFNKKGSYTVALTVTSADGCSTTSSQTDYLNVANFKTDFDIAPLICQKQETVFKNKSIPAPVSLTWVADGIERSNSLDTFKYTFSEEGPHAVKLKSIFGDCADEVEKVVTIKFTPQPTDFKAELQGVCGPPVAVNYADETPGATQWKWFLDYHGYETVPDAITQKISRTYSYESRYNVKLSAGSADGCFGSFTKNVDIYKPSFFVRVKSSTGKTSYTNCGPFDVTFNAGAYTGSVLDDIASYKWDFGDGGTSTDAEPTHTFAKEGSFVVKVDMITKDGCKGTGYLYSNIDMYFKPDITNIVVQNPEVCGSNSVLVKATFTGQAGTWLWNFYEDNVSYWNWSGSYLSDYAHSYPKEGVYDIAVIGRNPTCADTFYLKNAVKVNPPFARVDSYTQPCDGGRNEAIFRHACVGAITVTWDFGDGTPKVTVPASQPTTSHNYAKSGFYNVTVTATNGTCSLTSTTFQILFFIKQPFQLTAVNQNVCENSYLQLAMTNFENDGMRGYWGYSGWRNYYEDGTLYDHDMTYQPDYNYSNNDTWGLYNLDPTKHKIRAILTSEFGCKDTSNFVTYNLLSTAKANFEVPNTQSCFTQNSMAVFKDLSTAGSSTITKYEWSFGDGQTSVSSTGGNVSHTYSSPGIYYANLKITNSNNCVSYSDNSISRNVEIYGPKAAISASATTIELNGTVYFYNNTVSYGNSSLQYKWDFADGSPISSEYYPSHVFTKPGVYTVRFTATDPVRNCTSTATVVINVKNFLLAYTMSPSFVGENGCAPLLVKFTNTSTNFSKVNWDFGDGTYSTGNNTPSHIYQKAGKYPVKLSVENVNGLKGEFVDTVVVKSAVAGISADIFEVCKGQNVKLQANATNAMSYTWDFGDGSLSNSSNTTQQYAYSSSGNYYVGLLIKDVNGCTGSARLDKMINVHPDPVITIAPLNAWICKGAAPLPISASGGEVYTWSANDGTLSAVDVPNPTASPIVTSTYHLKVADNIGCKNETDYVVKVVQPITVKANRDTAVCMGNGMQFFASGASTYQWINFTEGLSNTNISSPTTTVRNTATYTVKGFDDYGCFTSTANVKVTALELPTVNAGADVKVLATTPVQLNAQGSSDVITWAWTPAKSLSCDNCAAPVCTPLSEMTYKVTVTNKSKCQASDEVMVKLECEAARVRVPNVFSPNDDGNNDLFIIKGIGLVKHLIIFDRWGTKVFERSNFVAADRSSCWDGMRNGMPVPAGTYVYFVELQCETGAPFVMKGTVVLVR